MQQDYIQHQGYMQGGVRLESENQSDASSNLLIHAN